VGSAPSETNQHAYGRIELKHASVNEISYFGPGPDSGSSETTFGLSTTIAQGTYVTPMRRGFAAYGNVAGLHATPRPAPSGELSTAQVFSDADAPGITQSTTYVMFGGGVLWRHPEDEISTGYATTIDLAVRRFAETSGAPYAFTRTTVAWGNVYTPDTDFDAGAIAATARFIISTAGSGDRVPFYLQPSLGGADIEGTVGLRGYSDYRFRAPDLWSTTVEYTRTVRDPVAVLVFYDVGRVANRAGDLLSGDIRQSIGAGVMLRVGGFAVAQMYVAWSGEGSRFGVGGNTNALGSSPTMRGVY